MLTPNSAKRHAFPLLCPRLKRQESYASQGPIPFRKVLLAWRKCLASCPPDSRLPTPCRPSSPVAAKVSVAASSHFQLPWDARSRPLTQSVQCSCERPCVFFEVCLNTHWCRCKFVH